MERKTGFEPAAFSLARRCSTTELLPLVNLDYAPSSRILPTDELERQRVYSPTLIGHFD